MEKETTPAQSFTVRDLFLLPIGCLMRASPYLMGGLFVLVILAWAGVLQGLNYDLFGTGAPDYKNMEIEPHFAWVKIDGQAWNITYESYTPVQYTGLVRHSSRFYEPDFPFLTQDVLVTTGDYANPDRVNTSVSDHHFRWVSLNSEQPQGSINLIHALPKNEAIFKQMNEVKNGQKVRITGFEILRIDRAAIEPGLERWWQDSGCNTLLITQVDILEK